MNHPDVRERLELAAVEPGGLDRLATGTDPGSAELADHLAGCDACRGELEALRRAVPAIRDAVQATPPAELRARTLEYVARTGRQRSQAMSADAVPAVAPEPSGRSPLLAWLPAVATGVAAAALLVAVVVGGSLGSRLGEADAAIAEQRTSIAGLTQVVDWTLRLGADPETTGIRLAGPGGGSQAGTVLFSSGSNQLVMVASGLPAPADGQEYRCWIETDGRRVAIGAMYRAGDLAYWVGELGEDVSTGEGQAFGVSLVASASEGVDGEVVLVGES